MNSFRSLKESWPLICLFLVTAIVVVWAGTMVHEVLAPPVALPIAQPQVVPGQAASSSPLISSSNPSSNPLPTSPSVPVTTLRPLANPSRLPTQGISPQAPQGPSGLSTPEQPLGQSPTKPLGQSSTTPKPSSVPNRSARILPQARYGHLPYAEAAPDRLVSVGAYSAGNTKRTEYLDQDAATAFDQMVAAAKTDGVSIIPISGFRSISQQEKLFDRQIQRQGSESAAARLSAPPGYSEHHTGYAMDVGDAAQPNTDVQHEFENTAAYRWLMANAKRFGFELSYPRNNVQGVSFEPWHWRYTASVQASAVFAVAHTLSQSFNPS